MQQITGEVSGILRIGASQVSAQYLIPSLLAEFQDQYPKIYIKLSVAPSNDIISLLENNFIDVGIIEDAKDTNNMLIKSFYQQELMLVVPKNHELARYEQVTMSELMRFPWVMREETSNTRIKINQYIKDNALQSTENKQIIIPDEKLKNLLKIKENEEVTYFNLQKYMNPHFSNK